MWLQRDATRDVEQLRPGDVLRVLRFDRGVLTVRGRAHRPVEQATRMVLAFLAGALVAIGLALIFRAVP